MKSKEFHDLSELALNSNGQSWGNLGYWTDGEDSYSNACRALAVQLGATAELNQDSILFDAGFGCGDQLCLWLEHYQVSDVCGINLSESQTQHAKSLLSKNGHSEKPNAIFVGSANDGEMWPEVIGTRKISHMIALDCAYHFPNRVNFFDLTISHLKTGSKLALTDFMLADQAQSKLAYRLLLSLMFRLSRIPKSNIVDQTTYKAELEAIGFHNIQIRDISQPVIDGFAHWVRSQTAMRLPFFARVKYRTTAAFLNWAYNRSILRYAVIVAEK
ncbi:MAG: methyltransferase domain-containing protein [Parasphingorhabdus sp.]